MNKFFFDELCCPKCKRKVIPKDDYWVCNDCLQKIVTIEGNIIEVMPEKFSMDTKLSLNKWEQVYKSILSNKDYEAQKQEYDRKYLEDTLSQISADFRFKRNDVYLEIGCGPMFLGQEIAKLGLKVIGIDFSLSALIIAKKMLEKNKIKNYLLIHGDIQNMPIREGAIDLIFGGGVIEHFKNTDKAVSEVYRVLKKGGTCFNSVPQLNLGSLTYRQVWGNIPNFPVLKQVAEFIHIKLLKKKHMRFGYELSFTKGAIKRIFRKQNFSELAIKRLKCYFSFDYLKSSWLKAIAQELVKLEIFNPMMLIIAKK